MDEYYLKIKTLIETYEVNHRVRALQDNSEKLQMNWHIGRLLVKAQGGSSRAKYGDGCWLKPKEEALGQSMVTD